MRSIPTPKLRTSVATLAMTAAIVLLPHVVGKCSMAADAKKLANDHKSAAAADEVTEFTIADGAIEFPRSGAETFGVVYALAESPVKQGLLWAGTDDGKLWKTENDGGSWTDLTASLPAAVKNVWISRRAPTG